MKFLRTALVAQKEWREIVRDKTFLGLAFLLPPLMLIVFGYGINQTLERVPLVVVDEDHTAESREYTDRFSTQRTFDFRGFLGNEAQAERALGRGEARVTLTIPSGFARALARGHASVTTRIDGTLPPSTRRPLDGYVRATSEAANHELAVKTVAARLGVSASRAALLLRPLELEIRNRYNPDLVNLWFTAPALIMYVLVFALPLLTALGVVREKESGSIYNVRASTLTRGEFLLGKLAPNLAISAIDAALLWLLARFLFGAPFRGSLGFFATSTLLYVACITALGLVLSLLVKSQVAAMIIATMLANIVGVQYSGMITPVASLTGPSRVVATLMPPMYYLEIVQGTFLKGLGIAELWREALVLAVQATALLSLAWFLFRKRTAT